MDLQLSGVKNREVQALGAPKSSAEMAIRTRVLKLLISGATPKQIAESIGISESRISQFKSEEAFHKELQAGLALKENKTLGLNEKYDKLEDHLVDKLSGMVKRDELKPREVLHALQVVGAKKRTPVIEPPNPETGNRIVHLHLSPRIANKFILNQNKDVVGLGNQDFIPMSSQALLQEVKGFAEKALESKDKIIEEAFQVGLEITTNGRRHANQIEASEGTRSSEVSTTETSSVPGTTKSRASKLNSGLILEGDI